jgi:hypothetical protein
MRHARGREVQVDWPYRFDRTSPGTNEVPELLRSRLRSVRAFDADAVMIAADVVDGRELESLVDRLFVDASVQYLHVHFARPGCYARHVDRA